MIHPTNGLDDHIRVYILLCIVSLPSLSFCESERSQPLPSTKCSVSERVNKRSVSLLIPDYFLRPCRDRLNNHFQRT